MPGVRAFADRPDGRRGRRVLTCGGSTFGPSPKDRRAGTPRAEGPAIRVERDDLPVEDRAAAVQPLAEFRVGTGDVVTQTACTPGETVSGASVNVSGVTA
jgi:hypothetical protein